MKKRGSPLVLIQFILLLPALNTGHSQAPNDWGLRLNTNYSSHYTGGGDRALLDGIRGNEDFRSPAWQGYLGVDLDVVVDRGRTEGLGVCRRDRDPLTSHNRSHGGRIS
jgi:hypothetical protein